MHILKNPIWRAAHFFKVRMKPFRILPFVMFSTLHDEMQYIFLEKNFIFMVFLAVKNVGTDVI